MVLRILYLHTLEQLNGKAIDQPTEAQARFYDDAITAINGLPNYGTPIFVKMTSFTQIESSGLQITKSPGKDIVYFGSIMLTLGMMLMIFIRQQRLWVYIEKEPHKRVILAGRDTKNTPEFSDFFHKFAQAIEEEPK